MKLGRGHNGVALRDARDDGTGRSVRDRGEVRAIPDRPALALVGDGAMQMNGMAELITAAKYYAELGRPDASSSSSSTTAT